MFLQRLMLAHLALSLVVLSNSRCKLLTTRFLTRKRVSCGFFLLQSLRLSKVINISVSYLILFKLHCSGGIVAAQDPSVVTRFIQLPYTPLLVITRQQ
ncbi:uncharacterized protein LOC125552889 isoform X4 [Triticum urartu]|uniref:uncharacterized protein LOC125552889 isoform X4 n=1 Tax=Triticum urartu TaxID=4572 RepID=UPI0020430772|nr:uncharacterized protein LOC125552889 isoform X4 [Triticum urartu]